jgi:hypothetical protein
MPRILASTIALGLVATLPACQDEPLAGVSPVMEPLAVTESEREELQAALLFAGELSVLALQSRERSAPLASAMISLLQRVERDDRSAVQEGLTAARDQLQRYGEVGESSRDPDLEVLALTLDFTAQLAGRTEKPQSDPVRRSESSSRQEP